MNKKKLLEELVIIFWIFIIGSILGYIFEMIVVLFQKGYFESRQGLIYGPFTPVYGIGGIAYYITFKLIKTRNKGLEYAKPIKVGSNVWIGGNVCVMPGVTIGDNVAIGAGSVVNKDIPSNCVAVGNPCKVIKEI